MKAIETIQRQLLGLIGRAVVKSISAATKCQTVDVSLIAGEPKAGVEHLEPYGFTARANSGAEDVLTSHAPARCLPPCNTRHIWRYHRQ